MGESSEVSSSSSFQDSMRHSFQVDRRAENPNFGDQMAYFCMSEEMADVEFIFNRQDKITKFPAHRFALSVASEVFQKMLTYGFENEAEKRSKTVQVVEIKDEKVEIESFKTMLMFIYNAYKNVNMTGELALSVLYIGMKYMIKPLVCFCVNFLLKSLNAENVFTVLQFCIDCETDKRLMEGCKEILRTKTRDVLKGESFLKISHKCLTFLLEDDSLDVAEIHLFIAVIRWAKYTSDKATESCIDNNLQPREKLKTFLPLIRFASMSMKEFGECVVPTGLLSLEEQRDIMLMIGGTYPIGPTSLCKETSPRGSKWQIDSLSQGKAYKFVTNNCDSKTCHKVKIRIDDFPSFVASKTRYYLADINVNDTKWSIFMDFRKYCPVDNKYIVINSSSPDSAESLVIFAKISTNGSKCNFGANWMLNSSKFGRQVGRMYYSSGSFRGYDVLMSCLVQPKIEVLLNEQNGYLINNSLEFRVNLFVSKCE